MPQANWLAAQFVSQITEKGKSVFHYKLQKYKLLYLLATASNRLHLCGRCLRILLTKQALEQKQTRLGFRRLKDSCLLFVSDGSKIYVVL